VVSYNPGYQSITKDLKQSTKQRFGALDFHYPNEVVETAIVCHESGVGDDIAVKLVGIASRSRGLRGRGLEEGISTRMLIHAGALIRDGIPPRAACNLAMTRPITDDVEILRALDGFVTVYFGP
jgi:nitric oxide reductase NorQ protein